MPANISFLAGENFTIQDLSGSGLGFYGAGGFGASVQVGAFQGRTFIVNSAGTIAGPEVDSVKYANAASGIIGQTGTGIHLRQIPNYLSTLNIRFTNDTAVKTQNTRLYIYDRVNLNNPASGVTTAVAEIVHPDTTQTMNGSGSATWQFPSGSGYMLLTDSPGTSGLRPNGANTVSTQHDYFVAISVSPSSLGSKLFGLAVSLEYL